MEVKPIETHYRGCIFRSRLEARWAVFFEALGLHWRYEAEGFQCGEAWYLPDFHLPDYDVYVEIKPPGHYELLKPSAAAQAGLEIVALVGDPWPWHYAVCASVGGMLVPFPTGQFVRCRVCGAINISVFEIDRRHRLATVLNDPRPDCRHEIEPPPQVMTGALRTNGLEEAFFAARSERFDRQSGPTAKADGADQSGANRGPTVFDRAIDAIRSRRPKTE